jgi:hypothetical protein
VAFALFNQMNKTTGGIAIVVFTLYIISTGYAIHKSVPEPPQMSDIDSLDAVSTAGEE